MERQSDLRTTDFQAGFLFSVEQLHFESVNFAFFDGFCLCATHIAIAIHL